VHKIFNRAPKAKRSVVTPRSRWEDNKDNIKIGLESMDWIHLTQFWDQLWTLVNTVISFRAP
jgi:hypothetical protein